MAAQPLAGERRWQPDVDDGDVRPVLDQRVQQRHAVRHGLDHGNAVGDEQPGQTVPAAAAPAGIAQAAAAPTTTAIAAVVPSAVRNF